MSFLRHQEIYRSDASAFYERGREADGSTPRPIVSMSFQPAIRKRPERVVREIFAEFSFQSAAKLAMQGVFRHVFELVDSDESEDRGGSV